MSDVVLETLRLSLEKLGPQHLEDLYLLLSNKRVQKHFPGTLSFEESKQFLEKVNERYIADGVSFWAVKSKADGKFLGICGLLKQFIEGIEEYEVAYRISDAVWGNGYGTEAAEGAILYGKEKLGKESIIALIRAENRQSIRVAEKNEMVFEREVTFHDLPHCLYRKRFITGRN